MRGMVTEGFYDRSRLGLWMFEAIGREYDDMAKWARTLRIEAFPLYCTWTIAYWEFVYGYEPDDSLELDFRRKRLFTKKAAWPPINPTRIENLVSVLTGCPVNITDPIRPYMFRITVEEGFNTIYNYGFALLTLRRIKPSHLSFDWLSHVSAEYTITDYSAAFTSVCIREYITCDEPDIVTDIVDYSAGVESGILREYYEGD